ncbi:MAG: hypothetical protein K2X35_08990 [Bryobacteraceae bacterium]|nr:hypothetical protein [Bryobacteraceae bacterium]
MKYWGFLLGKLALGYGVMWVIGRILGAALPDPQPFMMHVPAQPFGYDLGYTVVVLLYWLFAAGLLYLIVWDQRYRCRTCLRRLRMPVVRGSWTHVLLGPPSTEYICLYGHGTLKVAELQITGRQEPDWEPHEDIWTELESFQNTKK